MKPDKPEIASVVSKYVAEGPSEISLNVGQLVHVMLKNPDGWWQGELQVRNDFLIFDLDCKNPASL